MELSRPRCLLLISVMGVLVACIAPVQAAILAPGTAQLKPFVGLPGSSFYSTAQPVHYAGTPLATMVSPYVGDFSGSVTSSVYAGPAGVLGFEYIFTNENPAPGLPAIIAATIGDLASPWLGFSIVDAGADGSGASTPGGGPLAWTNGDPIAIERNPTAEGEGISIRWRAFGLGTVLMGPDDVSARIWLDVVAAGWKKTDVGLLDSGAVGTANAYAPSVIPEPATFAIWTLLGLAGLGYAGWRRRGQ